MSETTAFRPRSELTQPCLTRFGDRARRAQPAPPAGRQRERLAAQFRQRCLLRGADSAYLADRTAVIAHPGAGADRAAGKARVLHGAEFADG